MNFELSKPIKDVNRVLSMKVKKGPRYIFTKEYDLEEFVDFAELSYEASLKWTGEISNERKGRIRTLAKRFGLQLCHSKLSSEEPKAF